MHTGPALGDLSAAVGAALDQDWTDLPSSALREALSEASRLHDRLAALDAQTVGAYDASAEWAADGHRTTGVAVAYEANQTRASARHRVGRARKLRHLDHLAAALAAGEVSGDAADLLLRADRPDLHDALVRDEALLVDFARMLEHVDLVRTVRTWAMVNDPDGADQEAKRTEDQRSVHASTSLGGQVRIDGWLTAAGGAEWLAELERLEQRLFDADWLEARGRVGEKATKDDLRRTPAQRRHDAMVEMARRSAAYTGDGPAPRGRVVLNLHMDHGTFTAELARHAADQSGPGEPFGGAGYPADRLCELDDGTVITPSEALNAALGGGDPPDRLRPRRPRPRLRTVPAPLHQGAGRRHRRPRPPVPDARLPPTGRQMPGRSRAGASARGPDQQHQR